ncbi:MAG: pilus assembly protein PilC [Candidatus Omnitrophica bacterium CG11_big_fil_rev_8_21_14_0_20_42_13]|uniref:Pilus assembly protein PilC n=1 Tax=Candidatus Ghiorseimicrobium undicola TaxID=1974746 RepID=A0A2H0LYC1_9BACT|nr:MAG: pilus assembly protein PilC [Candidatus Omnitrophica bacterium CG11_big_fil_rev_8_21_14_0_20_42_13]
MANFKYTIINEEGKKIQGEVESTDRNSVISFLRKELVTIISVEEVGAQKVTLFGKEKAIKLGDLVVFSRQLATLVKAGVPLVKGLSIMQAQIENKSLQKIVNSLQLNIESGRSLSEALAGHPKIFSSIYINMVKAGEMGGALDLILEKMAGYLEDIDKLARKLKGALIYPSVVITMAVVITAFIFIKVIPSFKEMFVSLGLTLPLPTRIVIGISDFIRNCYVYILIFIAIAVVVTRLFIATEKGRMLFGRACLTIPILGNIILKVMLARFSRTLATLVKSGISIINSLDIVARTAGNPVIERALVNAKARVGRGEKIGESLRAEGGTLFPPLVIDMISVGEETGSISPMLDKISEFYEAETDAAISALMSLIEPMLIIFLGGIVAMIALSMFLPIMEIIKKLGH